MNQQKQIKIYKPGAYPHILEYEIGEIWYEVGECHKQIVGMEIEPKYVPYLMNNLKGFLKNSVCH